MKKRLFSLFCTFSMILGTAPAVPALEGEAERAADTLSTLNLLENEDYAIKTPASRASAVDLLVRLAGAETLANSEIASSSFSDVPIAFASSVSYAARRGWAIGFSTGSFEPEQTITANAWFSMLLRMLGYRDGAGDFAVSDAATFARRIGLVSRSYEGYLTLGDLYESAQETLRFSFKDGGSVIDNLIKEGICTQATANALGISKQELTAREVADRHMAAAFRLELYESDEDFENGTSSSSASGFFISTDGIAVTNYHSIDGAAHAIATLSTGESYEVERVIWYDVGMDLSILRISKTSTDNKTTSAFAALEIVGTSDIRPGDIVYTLSNPLGLDLAISSGVISVTARDVDRYTLPCVMNTADISQGSSGGALLNVYGRVIAVTSGAYRDGNSMYLAVPADILLTIDTSITGKTLEEVTQSIRNAQEN